MRLLYENSKKSANELYFDIVKNLLATNDFFCIYFLISKLDFTILCCYEYIKLFLYYYP